jgi:hypothetical protein
MSNTILTKNELLKLFKENIINFLDALIEQFNKESDFITLRVLFDGQIPIEEALNVFSQRIIPFLDMIKNKDENFFLNCDQLFEGISQSKVSHFKNIWKSPILTLEDREQLWRWFKLFGNLAKQYQRYM